MMIGNDCCCRYCLIAMIDQATTTGSEDRMSITTTVQVDDDGV
jgi:hypothetical protein